MAYRPQVFLFDEPLSNLDARLRLEARTFLKKLQRELGITTVFVTHDQAEALAMADRIAVMDTGQIRQIGTPTEVFRCPSNTFVANFIGSTPMNLMPSVVTADGAEFGGTRLPIPAEVGAALTDGEEIVYGIRPEYFACSPEPVKDAVSGEVTVVEPLGSAHLVSMETAGGEMRVTVPEEYEPAPGDRVWAVPRRDRALIYRDGELVRPARTGLPPRKVSA